MGGMHICFVLSRILDVLIQAQKICFVVTNHLLLLQWLALDKEAKKLLVETTANQVKDVIRVCFLFI
jgi:hypothetical protein